MAGASGPETLLAKITVSLWTSGGAIPRFQLEAGLAGDAAPPPRTCTARRRRRGAAPFLTGCCFGCSIRGACL
jgi:hypothetical protein